MPKPKLNLYALTRQELLLIRSLTRERLSLSVEEQGLGGRWQSRARNIERYLSGVGLRFFVGAVTDQDGDAEWEIATSLKSIHQWADDISFVSFERPKLYEVLCEKNRIGRIESIDYIADPKRSRLN